MDKDIILVDNHNHAYYFWYQYKSYGIVSDNSLLIHIDEHADTRKPKRINYSRDLTEVFNYTNYELNVGNYIIPALEEGLIGNVFQIRSEANINEFLEGKEELLAHDSIILNLDLDFFETSLDYIDYELKKKIILEVASKAKLITIAISPFFIDRELAIKVFKDIFGK